MPERTPRPAPDAPRDALATTRRALFRLHKSLIDSERAVFEGDQGPMSSGQFLQALINDEAFAWLRPLSRLIVEMDETLAPREPLDRAALADLLRRTRDLLAEADAGGAEPGRVERAARRDPDVLLRRMELDEALREADGASGRGRE